MLKCQILRFFNVFFKKLLTFIDSHCIIYKIITKTEDFMKKIEFDLSNGKFLIESNDEGSEEFIKEYTELFFDKLSTYQQSAKPAPAYAADSPKEEAGLSKQSNDANSNQSASDSIIDLFGITSKQLSYLIDFSNDNIKIIVRNKIIKGNRAEMQVKLSLLYCGACEYKGQKANTKDIRNICSYYQCLDGNFAQNIKRDNYFNISGAVNADICLTMPGKDKLVDVVSEIITLIENN